jgi:hypothetical protein
MTVDKLSQQQREYQCWRIERISGILACNIAEQSAFPFPFR